MTHRVQQAIPKKTSAGTDPPTQQAPLPRAVSARAHRLEEIMAYNPVVDFDKCVGCGECVDVCPVEVYELQDGKSNPVNAEECLGCESCVEVCEHSAIEINEA